MDKQSLLDRILHGTRVDFVRPTATPVKSRVRSSVKDMTPEERVIYGKNSVPDVSKLPRGTVIGTGVGP